MCQLANVSISHCDNESMYRFENVINYQPSQKKPKTQSPITNPKNPTPKTSG